MSTLSTVQKFFPQVERVVDAQRIARIDVTPKDAASKGVKKHETCAMAVACKRKFHLDGVIISRSVAYLIKGKQARRFQLPPSVAREVVSFDRGAGFATGSYHLAAISPTTRSDTKRKEKPNRKHIGESITKRFRHVTTDVRAVLGGINPDDQS